jgi:hypothetical protein
MPTAFNIPGPLILASIAIMVGTAVLILGPMETHDPIFSLDHGVAQQTSALALPLREIEHSKSHELAGDSKIGNDYLEIDLQHVNPEGNCEFCSRFEYKDGPQGRAGFLYTTDRGLDLTGAKRVVFWAMGEDKDNGVKLNFLMAGKEKNTIPSSSTDNPYEGKVGEIFENLEFGATTDGVFLESDWKRYQISLDNVDLKNIRHLFGFEISKEEGEKEKVFYLKGITIDQEYAEQPLATIKQ